MSERPEESEEKDLGNQAAFSREVGHKAARKLRAKRNKNGGVWFGLGMMGLIGWSVVVPTLLGAALGLWLDNRHQGSHSWVLILMVSGLCLGCANAWHWVAKQNGEIREDEEDDDD
jgi:ATP synthase protein I